MANELIFDSSAKKTAVFLATIHHPKWPYQGTSAKLRQGSQINWNVPIDLDEFLQLFYQFRKV